LPHQADCLAAAITTAMVGVLELLQLFVPGPHARLVDFIVDAVAALAGFAVMSLLDFAAACDGGTTGSAPEVLEPIRRQLGVAHRMLDVLVAQVGGVRI
jgi:hypothetical protein